MTKQDEPAYMLAAREYARYGDKVFTIGPGTVKALLEHIDRLERAVAAETERHQD